MQRLRQHIPEYPVFRIHSALHVDITLTAIPTAAFDPDIAINIYRILQEFLTNIARHSAAGNVTVHFGEQGGDLVLDVRDDGAGMEHADTAGNGGLGIAGMRERAALCGGRVAIESAPGRGARVCVRVPAKRE